MKRGLYPRLAVTGIIKNRKLYLPYLLSTIGMVMLYFILHSLSRSPFVLNMVSSIGFILSLGKFVIAAFSLLFLFYTNSFLIRRRNKEFGLYSVLGMDKQNIAKIVLWESLFVASIGILAGIALGVVFSKLAELGLLNMMHTEISYDLSISGEAVFYTVALFGAIFLLLTFRSLIAVGRAKPLELMQSEQVGEKPVKANWVFAVLGALLLGVAYYMSVSIDAPLTALLLFFAAVIMVIVATYLLFVSGSVVLCKLLKKKKSYYFTKKHFISVSSMTYRMKRNGAGLASICILSTMVLVMISLTGSLYFGVNDAMRTRYPLDCTISVELQSIDDLSDEKVGGIRNAYEEVFRSHDFTPKDAAEYRYGYVAGRLNGDRLETTPDFDSLMLSYDAMRAVYFFNIDDYNRMMGTDETLSDGEALLYTLRCKYEEPQLQVDNLQLKIAKKLDQFLSFGEASSMTVPTMMVVVQSFDVIKPLSSLMVEDEPVITLSYYYGYNADIPDEKSIEIFEDQTNALQHTIAATDNGYSYSGGCIAKEKDDFFSTFGGMFFLGIILSIAFIFGAAVIIYYKQVSEGYEDQKRFEIMRNIGMTKQDIKKTINSQVLTVFYAPLLFAGLHLGFAFPFVWKILQMFNLSNLGFVLIITAIAFVVFSLLYALIYRITARAYYSIVAVEQE